jgi:lipid-A-disaccharide synthase
MSDPPILLVLPGSRASEIRRLAGIFGDAVAKLGKRAGPLDVVLPTLPHIAAQVTAAVASWPVHPRIVIGAEEKHTAFRTARAALAASGTVTLELALAQVPTVAAYRIPAWEGAVFRLMAHIDTVILANLVLGEKVVPEYLQGDCTPDRLALALVPLLADTPERRRQLEAFARLDTIMDLSGEPPSRRAAHAILAGIARKTALPSPPASC